MLVIGYGLVGQGVAAAAKAFGGQVMVAEIDPARRPSAGGLRRLARGGPPGGYRLGGRGGHSDRR